jgi:hypothetical protein
LRSNSRRAAHCAASSPVRAALAWTAASASAASRTSASASAMRSSMWCEFQVSTCTRARRALGRAAAGLPPARRRAAVGQG